MQLKPREGRVIMFLNARSSTLYRQKLRCCRRLVASIAEFDSRSLGFIGLGSMGSQMVVNLRKDGRVLHIFDKKQNAIDNLVGDNIFPSVSEIYVYITT